MAVEDDAGMTSKEGCVSREGGEIVMRLVTEPLGNNKAAAHAVNVNLIVCCVLLLCCCANDPLLLTNSK